MYQAIIGDSVLNGLGITGPSSFAVDVDTPASRPFLQLRWGRNNVGLDVVTQRDLVVWVHDQPADYSVIDSIIRRLRVLLPTLISSSDSTGWVMGVDWTGDSEDLTDDGHKTIARNASFTMTGSGQ